MITALALAALAVAPVTGPPTPPSEPAPMVVTAGPAMLTPADSYYSTAASQLVVVLEVTATELVNLGFGSVYVGPDGQQVEASDYIDPGDVFPGATALAVFAFPAATPGGAVNLTVYDDDFNDFNVSLPVDGDA